MAAGKTTKALALKRSVFALRITARIRFGAPRLRSSTKPLVSFEQVQILLGHTKIENTVRYLGVDIEDADSQRELKSDYGGGPRFQSGLPLEQS